MLLILEIGNRLGSLECRNQNVMLSEILNGS